MSKKASPAVAAHKRKMRALRDLEDGDGRLTPDRLVNAARRSDHPWHDSFEWDDAKAAAAHRTDTARRIIREYSPIMVTSETVQRRVPVYVRDPRQPSKEQGYVNVERVRDDPELKREVLVAEFKRAAEALQRAYDVADVLKARTQVKTLIDQVNRLRERSEAARL